MIKQLMAVLILIFLFTSTVAAESDSVTIGPYKVSFDLNIFENYSIDTTGPKDSETLYDNTPFRGYFVTVNSSKYYAIISISRFGRIMYTKNETDMQNQKAVLASACDDQYVHTINQRIDGHDGLMSMSNNCNLKNFGHIGHNTFLAEYWIDEVDNYGNTSCMILSSFPWENGTASLLKTIHVEELSDCITR